VSDDDSKYNGVLQALRDLHVSWQSYQTQLGTEITEYKKTVNNAISLLAQEALKFQADTKERLVNDATDRTTRQQFVDKEAERREKEAERWRMDATAANAAFQKRAGRERIALLSGVGCLIVVNVLALLALAVVLIIQNWR
jgi:ABC-type multidrug transport system fused ATPase/permease subunit